MTAKLTAKRSDGLGRTWTPVEQIPVFMGFSDRCGRPWKRPLQLRIRRLGVRVPPSALKSQVTGLRTDLGEVPSGTWQSDGPTCPRRIAMRGVARQLDGTT